MADSRNENLVPGHPVNADRMLFVEDLFYYMDLEYPSNYVMEWDPRQFRENIYYDSERTIKNAFNSTVKNAVRFFQYAVGESELLVFDQIEMENPVSLNTYKVFAENLAEKLPKDFHPKYFFMYCVILCRISELFYDNGVLNATLVTKKCLLKLFQMYNMRYEEWYSVNEYAKIYEEVMQHAESVESNFQEQQHACPINEPLKKSITETNLEKEKLYNDIKDECKERMLQACNIKKVANYRADLERNKSIDKSASDNTFSPGPSSAYQESAHVAEMDCRRNLSVNAIDSKNSTTLSTKGDKMSNKISPNDRFRHMGTANTYQKASSTSKKDCGPKLSFSSDVTNGSNFPSTSSGRNNLISKAEPKVNLVSKAPSTDQLSVSSRRKLEFSSNNENNAKVENIPLTRERSPILRNTIKSTGLERCSPSTSDHEKSP